MMSTTKAIVLAVAASLAMQLAAAAMDHPVGGDGTWDNSGTNYNAWTAQQKIQQGDSISFKYTASHNVVEVTKAGYDACSGGNPIKSYTDGSTTVKLTTPGDHYFICTVPGHCASGMKLKVTVAAAAAAAPAPTKSTKPSSGVAPASAPADEEAPATTSTPETSTPKPSDAATVVGAKAVMALAASVALAMAM